MAKRKKIDAKALLKMVKDGIEQSEIMKQFGFKTSTQLKVAYANALIDSGDVPKIKGTRKGKKKVINPKITVSKRGSLSISKKMVESMGLEVGDTFEAKKTAAGISLKAVKEAK